jgi:ell wall binding domain 2 (CWB2)
MRRWLPLISLAACLLLCGCGSTKLLVKTQSETLTVGAGSTSPQAVAQLGIPVTATKNTTRVGGADPIADAAGVARAVYPSEAPGTHPGVVTIAPTSDWEAAIAASVLMAPPVRAPMLLSGSDSMPAVTSGTLKLLAPTGSHAVGGAQVIGIGDVPAAAGLHTTSIKGNDPYTLAAGIDRFFTAATGKPSSDVVIASVSQPAYAMPAAGWAAESGDPILFVGSSVPAATRKALVTHHHPHIYVLGPPSVIDATVMHELAKYGTVKRVGSDDPAANSVAFAEYRDPACPFGQPCAHIPGSFGWAIRNPGHGYVVINAGRTLDAAAAAPLSGTGDYGPQLLVDNASTLPRPVLNFFLNYATPGFTPEGQTLAVYNHGWMIGDPSAISVPVQAEIDNLLQAVPEVTR